MPVLKWPRATGTDLCSGEDPGASDVRFRLLVRGISGNTVLDKDGCNPEALVQDIMREIVASLERPVIIQLCLGSLVLRSASRIGEYKTGHCLELLCIKLQGRGLRVAPMNSDFDFDTLWVLLGDPAVGKSCLRLQFTDRLQEWPCPTMGFQETSRIVCIGGATVRMQIVEVGGYRQSLGQLSGYDGAFLVYDVTQRHTFDRVGTKFFPATAAERMKTRCLIGNKADKDRERQVSYEDGQQLANELGLLFMETSSSAVAMVDEAFFSACEASEVHVERPVAKTGAPPPAPSQDIISFLEQAVQAGAAAPQAPPASKAPPPRGEASAAPWRVSAPWNKPPAKETGATKPTTFCKASPKGPSNGATNEDLAQALSNHLQNPSGTPSVELMQALARAANIQEKGAAAKAEGEPAQKEAQGGAEHGEDSLAGIQEPEASEALPSRRPSALRRLAKEALHAAQGAGGGEAAALAVEHMVKKLQEVADEEPSAPADGGGEEMTIQPLPIPLRAFVGPDGNAYQYDFAAANDDVDACFRNIRRRLEVEMGDGCVVQVSLQLAR
ncbi:Ras-related protein Rab-2A [Symbiodinium microadriaticum]|uniref:Ras-related protein Rab-2A n=1 Tax=Symbiodinium microadriaticum TaxID=2951 RepID=A0A1Q9DTQ2_SYMMI|nr:Ras-related protein Rab-2A [Symbiodinium microadriaticum]CAE7943862.1 rab2A [Symbiodinium sp. KB8]